MPRFPRSLSHVARCAGWILLPSSHIALTNCSAWHPAVTPHLPRPGQFWSQQGLAEGPGHEGPPRWLLFFFFYLRGNSLPPSLLSSAPHPRRVSLRGLGVKGPKKRQRGQLPHAWLVLGQGGDFDQASGWIGRGCMEGAHHVLMHDSGCCMAALCTSTYKAALAGRHPCLLCVRSSGAAEARAAEATLFRNGRSRSRGALRLPLLLIMLRAGGPCGHDLAPGVCPVA